MAWTSQPRRIAFAPEHGHGGGRRLSRPLVPGIPSRVVDPSGVVKQHCAQAQTTGVGYARAHGHDDQRVEDGVLVVCAGITVTGDIRACRKLVVHGAVEATLPATTIEVGPTGQFHGRAEVETATIAGHFEGELIVTGCLTVTGNGTVDGRVRYQEIVVELGGRVLGTTEPLTAIEDTSARDVTASSDPDPASERDGRPAAAEEPSTAAGDDAPAHRSSGLTRSLAQRA